MANICSNTFYCFSEDPNNIKVVKEFLKKELDADVEDDTETIDAYFDSRWDFPEKTMNELYNLIPNKDDIYMRCLSTEYGNDYIGYHKCEKEGWYDALYN